MRIGIIGKGGSGKTTLSAALAQQAAMAKEAVLAIDADINQTLGPLLGFDTAVMTALPPLGTEKDRLRRQLLGSSNHIASEQHIVKTTLPTPGGGLVRLSTDDEVLRTHGLWRDNLCLLPIGGFTASDIGVACYHSKTGVVELLLNHLPDTRLQTVITDFSAGADLFASGLFTRYDRLLLVVEPTAQSVQVALQIMAYAADYEVGIWLAAHKLQEPDDLAFITDALGRTVDFSFPAEPAMRQMARRGVLEASQLSPAYRSELQRMLDALRTVPRDRQLYWSQAADWHRKNAFSWANAATGTDLTRQLDEDYLATLNFP
jgi:CO dehydrogenase maturation factor